jgi:hypothetical protein
MKRLETRIDSAASAEELWAVLVDFESYPSWNPTVVSIKGKAVLGESIEAAIAMKSGRIMRFRPTIVEFEPGRRFAWQGRLLLKQLFSGRHRFEVVPRPGGATFVHSEDFHGLLLPLLGMLLRDTEETLEAMNKALVAEVERRRSMISDSQKGDEHARV